jgi:hypothetical protein
MKKTCVLITGILILILVNSCVTTTVVWDETYPPEESATILFYQMTVKSYNGIGVNKWVSVTVPSGETLIGGDVRINHAGVGFLAQDMEFVCYLEGAKEYLVAGATKDGKWGVNLYTGKALRDDMLLEFIPFKIQPDTFK